MLVQVKTDNNISGSENLISEVQSEVAGVLDHYVERITRVDVFLSDMNAKKSGIDKRCVMEAHVAGLQRLAAEHQASTLMEAVSGAVERLERIIGKTIERRGDHKGSVSMSGDDAIG